MKKTILSIVGLAISYLTFAQAPQSFQYQAVVRDVNGVALINQLVDFQLSIIPGLPTNPAEYVETHTGTLTNAFGIVTLSVGSGITTDNFTAINWGTAPHFIKVEADLGSGLLDMGTTQLLSVPYALYAETAGNVTTYTAGNGISIAGNVITNTAPDQTVILNGSGATSVTGTYPNFTISSTDNVNDTDADPANEIQVLSISNDTLYLSNGGYVFMGNYSDTLWKKSGNSIYNTNSDNVGVGINNPVGRMVVQGSATALATDPLFEVKNSIGQSVFVVWQDSVQVYINDDAIESNRGGFAVSGRNMSKALTHDYLRITPDSARIYISDSLNSEGFAIQGINTGGNINYLNVSVDTTEIINPSQARVLWYPSKEAFLTGRVLIESPDSVGLNSFATGFESKAIGMYSQAMGYKTKTSSEYSTSIGKNTIAGGLNSFSFGDSSLALGNHSFAMGYKSKSTGEGAIAFGTVQVDTAGNPSSLITQAEGAYSFAAGLSARTTVAGFGSISIGMKTETNNYGALSIGSFNKCDGFYSSTIGSHCYTNGYYSSAIGFADTANGLGALAIGFNSKAIGENAVAIGVSAFSSGFASNALGFNVIASGDASTAFGHYVSTNGKLGAFIYGDASTLNTTLSTLENQFMVRASGGYVYYTDPLLLEINTMYLSPLSGNLGVGWSNPQAKVDINGSLRVNSGTTFNKIEGSSSVVGTNLIGGVKVSAVVFPTPFIGTPKITVTVKGGNYNDVFAVTTRNANNLGFQVNIYRVDNAGGTWNQNLEIDWIAWE